MSSGLRRALPPLALLFGCAGLAVVVQVALRRDEAPVEPLGEAPPAAVRTARLAPAPLQRSVLAFGTVTAWQDALVAAEVPGVVREVLLPLGGPVRAGDPLVRLDDRQRAIALRQADAELLVAAAQLDQSTRLVASLDARLSTARETLEIRARELERWRELAERAVVSSDRRDQAEKELRAALLALQQVEGELSIARAQAASAEAALARTQAARDAAALELERCVVRAPFAGEVAERRVEPGAWIAAGSPVGRVVDASRVRIRVHVRETDAPLLRAGAAAEVSVPGLPAGALPTTTRTTPDDGSATPLVSGRIEGVAAAVDPRARKLALDVAVENPGGLLRPGMFARVRLDAGLVERAVLVPDAAVVADGEAQAVYVVEADRARRRRVVLGHRQGEARLLVSGLELPCELVVDGTALLFDGAPVRRLAE